ncbi:MAG: DUF6048 family protein [Bacteroidales bacterium]|nr:DUF6048 family protein [Bacteroidales bacterium]
MKARKEAPMNRMRSILLIAMVAIMACIGMQAQRKVTPVNNKGTQTQPINEFANDTARMNARMREGMVHYHDENGNVIYVDTVTGREWRDTTAIKAKKPMQYPLLHDASVSVDLWNPLMRAFGQHYGLIGFGAQVSLHNRYLPTFETGLGLANNTPADNNFTYKSPLSVYFRLGMDYNFLYNSTPDYRFFLGFRFGLSPFHYDIEDITITSTYWDETATPTIPTQSSTVTWWEINVGLQVKLWGPISAGWSFRYHKIMHETKNTYGLPWYIPGYGARGTSIAGALNLTYTLDVNKIFKRKVKVSEGNGDDSTLYFPDSTGQPNPDQINQGMDAQNPE